MSDKDLPAGVVPAEGLDVDSSTPTPETPVATGGLVVDEPGDELYLHEPGDEVADASTPKQEEEEAPKPPRADSTNVRQDYPTSLPFPDGFNRRSETLMLPAGTNEEINEAVELAPNVRLDDTAGSRAWAQVLNEGTNMTMIGSALHASVKRADSMWAQHVDSELGVLMAKAPQFKDKPGVLLTGERAVLRLRHLTGQGSVYQTPLWHSGFWVTFKAPSDASMLELQRRILQEKIDLGRHVHGLAFSNHSVYIAGWLTEFALSHVYDTNVKDLPNESLRDVISTLDLPALLWGMACVIWPNGFQYAQACANDPAKCNYVIKELLDVTKLQWTDNRQLNTWQASHMSMRNKKVTLDAVEKYKNEFVVGKPRVVKLSPEVSAQLSVPSIQEYLTAGNKWVGSIVQMIDKAFSLTPEDGQRNAFIAEQGQASTMRQFGHWVDELDMGNDQKITDEETLEMSLDALSGRDDIVETYLTEIGKFMDDATVSVIAINTHECPSCGTKRASGMPRYPHLLPLDVMSTFFTLLGQKATLIRNR